MSEDDKTITLTRTIEAPLDDVFRAWTDPAMLEQWQADFVDADSYEGGAFRFETEGDEEAPGEHIVSGEYLRFEPDQRLTMTWHYRGPQSPEGDSDSELDVTFKALTANKTEVTIRETSEDHSEPEYRIFSLEAWSGAMELLAELLE